MSASHDVASRPAADRVHAWCAVMSAFLAGFVVFGIMYSFGAFIEPMAVEFQAGSAATAAVFSVTGVAFYACGPVTGHLSDRVGPRLVVAAGAILLGAGLVLTAWVERVWIGYLTFGIGVGVGAACAYVPTLATVGGWFSGDRKAAFGIAAAGTGCGMLIVPPLAALLIERHGWRQADIILGVGSAAILLVCALLSRRPPRVQSAVDESPPPVLRVVRSAPFVLLYLSWVLATIALFVPFVFLPASALEHGVGQVAASALISVLGAMSIVGRLGFGVIGERVSTLRLFKLATLAMGASYALWLVGDAYGWLLLFAAVLGLAYGVRISLMPLILIELFGERSRGAILGAFFTATGISALVGPPLAGLIVDFTGGYRWAVVFALATGLLGAAVILRLKAET